MLDLPLGTVKTHLFRAKATLKNQLDGHLPGGLVASVHPDERAEVGESATVNRSAMRWALVG